MIRHMDRTIRMNLYGMIFSVTISYFKTKSLIKFKKTFYLANALLINSFTSRIIAVIAKNINFLLSI